MWKSTRSSKSSISRTSLATSWLFMCDMTRSYTKHNSFRCGTWLIQMWDMTHSDVGHDSFKMSCRALLTFSGGVSGGVEEVTVEVTVEQWPLKRGSDFLPDTAPECRALLLKCRALLLKYRALVMECRALLMEYRALVTFHGGATFSMRRYEWCVI